MKAFAMVAMPILLAASCADPAQSAAPAHTPPPPPPPRPTITQDEARAQALALGVGSCDDLLQIKVLPFKDEIGEDTQFDRMVVNFDGYKACLIGKITDRTEIQDRSVGPKRHPYTVGGLAYDVITSSGRLDYLTCMPPEISASWEHRGAQALTDWLTEDGNPEILQACVQEQLGGT